MAAPSSSDSPTVVTSPCRVAVLLSGTGSNLQAIIDAAASGELHARICLVVSDKPDALGLERARRASIPAAVVLRSDYANRDAFESAIAEQLERQNADLVVLAGFMRILGEGFVARYHGRMLNIHPSLLPKYRGLDTYRRAMADAERWHGTSVHFVTEELDGGPVIAQTRVRIRPDDDEDSLRARVLAQEHVLYPKVVDWFCRGWLKMEGDQVSLNGETRDKPILFDATSTTEAT